MRALFKVAATAAVVLSVLIPAAAIAQAVASAVAPDTAVTVPWGDWLAGILAEVAASIGVILLAVLAWAARFLPAGLSAWATNQRIKQVEQLLERAVLFGINQLEDKVKGKAITFDVQQKIIADAVNYAIDHGPAKIIAWLGGEKAIREKIIARLPSPATANVVTTVPGPTVAVPAPAVG